MENATGMGNLELYQQFRAVPDNAQRAITGGRLKGKTEINPMWRIKALTEVFGPCGIGWKYEITKKWLQPCEKTGEIAAFVDLNLYFLDKTTGTWSEAIPGTGGSMFCANERNGPNCSDECYKMATTDALSVAAKALGVGADIYWQADSTKYTTDAAPAQQQGKAKKPVCAKCGRPLQGLQFKNGQTITLEQAQIKFDGLCYSCWKKQQAAQKEAQA